MKQFFLFFLLLLLAKVAFAQSEVVQIDSVLVAGNKRTRTANVLREITLKSGDTLLLANLDEVLARNASLLKSTGLFSKAELIAVPKADNRVNIVINLEEAWFIYPFFNISFADRNFNIWWVEQNGALNRLNYTLQVSHRNLTGRRDLLTAYAQFGYEPKFQLNYSIPYFNAAKTLGFRGDIFYAQAKEWGLRTLDNRLDLLSNEDEVIIQRFRLTGAVRFQKGLFTWHDAALEWHRNQISDFAAAANPNFFLNGDTQQRYFALTYRFTADYRDFRPYPLNGHYLQAELRKEGFGALGDVNTLTLDLNTAYYRSFFKKFSVAASLRGKLSLLREQPPYFNYRAIGYRPDYMRGFEYYVIDGLDYAMLRTSVQYEWLNKNLNINKKSKRQRSYFPLRIYSTIFHDEAFVNNPFYAETNDFSNRFLWSVGTGLNFVIYNDFVLRIEYTHNQFRERDVYLHFELPF